VALWSAKQPEQPLLEGPINIPATLRYETPRSLYGDKLGNHSSMHHGGLMLWVAPLQFISLLSYFEKLE
jgi:hypothetical protein